MANENWKEKMRLKVICTSLWIILLWLQLEKKLLWTFWCYGSRGRILVKGFFPEWPPGRSCISILVKWALFIGNTEGNHNVTNVYQLTRQKCLHQCQLSTCTQSLQWFCKLLSDLVHKLLLVMIASFVFVRRLPFLCELNSWGDKLRWLVGIRGRVVNFLDWNTSSP